MHKRFFAAAVVAALTLVPTSGASANGSVHHDSHTDHHDRFTLAVFGDSPYGASPTDVSQMDGTPEFVDSINADPQVRGVIHVGDIHSGKQYCTEAYDRAVYGQWTRFADPLVYTPGDNEWADCHKPAEGGGTYNTGTGQIDYVLDPTTQQPVDYAKGDPLANLDLVRSIFFATPGRTLGQHSADVLTQAKAYDRHHPGDARYVENVLWAQQNIVFVTINVPGGSNNDADPWYKTPTASAAQEQEKADRTAADIRWLDLAFAAAQYGHAQGVAIVAQADMWDLDGKTPSHLTSYEPLIASVASHTTTFGGPVLMFNGDSHVYRSDNPLSASAPCTGELAGGSEGACASEYPNHPGYDVANFHRVVVHGSTFPLEWLKLTVGPGTSNLATANGFGPFSWARMPQA